MRGEELRKADKEGDLELVRACLMNGVQVDERDSKRSNALHHAAFYGHLDVVNALLSAGACAVC